MTEPRRRADLLARLSHDIRSPLHGIIGFAEIMYRGKAGPVSERHREFLGDILSSARRLTELIEELFSVMRDADDAPLPKKEVIDLVDLAGEVRDALRLKATVRAIAVDIEVDPELGPIVGDRERTWKILHGSLANTLELAPSEGRVTIRCRAAEGDGYRIEVSGQGSSFAAVLPRSPGG